MIFAKQYNFELEICVKARGGRTARCMGDVPVAEMIASEAYEKVHFIESVASEAYDKVGKNNLISFPFKVISFRSLK